MSFIEVAWVAVVFVGLCFGVANLLAALREREVVEPKASRFGLTLLTGNLWMVASRTVAQVAMLAAGIAAITDPGNAQATIAHQHAIAVITGGLFIAGLCITANSVIGWDMRRRLTHLIVTGDEVSMNREAVEGGE